MDARVALTVMNKIEAELSPRDQKYRRNYRMYFDSYRGEDMRNPTSQPLGFYFSVDDAIDRAPPVLNVAKRAVDSIVSMMSQVKVRPFFNPVNGKFKTRKVARKAQIFFDELFQRQNVYVEAPEVLRDAAIFEVGYLWADEEDQRIKRVRPWEFYFSQNQYHYHDIRFYHLRFDYYPVQMLKKKLEKKPEWLGGNGDWLDKLEKNPLINGKYQIAYDLEGKERIEFLNGREIDRKPIDFDECTVQEIYYKKPVKGSFSTSLIDDVYTIQLQINDICRKISSAVNLTPANLVLIPKGNGQIKTSMLSAENGYVYEFTPIQGSPPISVVTPAPFDPEYLNILKFFIEQGMNTPGVSDMQALAKKPGSLQSGEALETLDDISSARQNVILNAYISLLMRTANACVRAFPKSSSVVPGDAGKGKVTWAEVREQKDNYHIQFSASSSLSKDPKTKLQQIVNLTAAGYLDKALAAEFMEMPDLEDAFSIINSGTDYNRYLVERAVEKGKYDFYEVTDIDQLFSLAIDELLQCAAAEEDDDILGRLREFIVIIQSKRLTLQSVAQPPMPPAPAQQGGQNAGQANGAS